ncbi:DUF456 domain-containing protein [Nocardioides limicola]|uniref:DUF456 domain-containing protein n=1 Tax=Nocardioides limicola TaxID=2803368 RepID=UPI00193BEF28|nr:DUF456 domain-containing protein [Nocardioides sp. DJM-14]
MSIVEIVVGLLLLIGVAGIVVPVLPGTLLMLLTLLGWGVYAGGDAWWVVLVGGSVLIAGAVTGYAVPGKRLKASGVPGRSIMIGVVAAVAGFFVVPVIGLILGFVAGVYLAETLRVGPADARVTTTVAVRSVGLGILIEATLAFLVLCGWLLAVLWWL